MIISTFPQAHPEPLPSEHRIDGADFGGRQCRDSVIGERAPFPHQRIIAVRESCFRAVVTNCSIGVDSEHVCDVLNSVMSLPKFVERTVPKSECMAWNEGSRRFRSERVSAQRVECDEDGILL
jgi:hypothetical protein